MYIRSAPITDMKEAYIVKGKNVVVTGGNRGIGRGITQAFAESGANVAILCRNLEKWQKTAEEIGKFGGRYTAFNATWRILTREKGGGSRSF